MPYSKVLPALARVKPDKLFGVRMRSTIASKKLKSEDAPLDSSCAIVETQDLISGAGARIGSAHISIDFDNTQEAYKSKDTLELLRSLLVFKLCTFDFLVDKNKEVSLSCWKFFIYL